MAAKEFKRKCFSQGCMSTLRPAMVALVMLLIAGSGLMPSSTLAQSNPVDSDRAILIALYNATDGPNWEDNTNWLSDAPMGTWYGVTTDNSGRVVSVHLGGNGLRGRIPSELGKLSNLRELILSYNLLTGAIPPQLGNLAFLQDLSLHYNYLSGSIPPELGSLTGLEALGLNNNRFSGAIPPEFGSLPSLKKLVLDNNQLVGAVPRELGSLVTLTDLLVDRNLLNGEIPTSLTKLSGLARLHFQDNDGLCAPSDAAFQEWLDNISDRWGKSCSGVTIRSAPTPSPFDAAMDGVRVQLAAEWALTPTPKTIEIVPVQTPTSMAVITTASTPVPGVVLEPEPTTTPKVERGFFTNSVPSPGDMEAALPFDIMDPVTLTLIGVLVTLGATAIQLFRGR